VRVAYRATAEIVRRVPADVFWPRPNVDSALVRLVPHPPPVSADPGALFRVVEEGFAERRKTMTNALRRLGLGPDEAKAALREAGIDPAVRAEELDLSDFARITATLESA
jgi:16S rRNA (adenine1518-N6/adenine1519-N6)-dimethyltransferase